MSSGKDNRTVLYDASSGSVLYELPTDGPTPSAQASDSATAADIFGQSNDAFSMFDGACPLAGCSSNGSHERWLTPWALCVSGGAPPAAGGSDAFGAVPTANGMRYTVSWSKCVPALLASASFDRKVEVHNLSSEWATSVHPFTSHSPRPPPIHFVCPSAACGGRAPRWLKRPVSVSFGFGGKVVVTRGKGALPPQLRMSDPNLSPPLTPQLS